MASCTSLSLLGTKIQSQFSYSLQLCSCIEQTALFSLRRSHHLRLHGVSYTEVLEEAPYTFSEGKEVASQLVL